MKEQKKLQAAGNCSKSCSRCQSNCTEQAAHAGTHRCNAGHSW